MRRLCIALLLTHTVLTPALAEENAPEVSSARTEVRVVQMEEEIRRLRGQIEQLQFSIRQLGGEQKKLSEDLEYRLRTLEEKQASHTPAPAATTLAPAPAPEEDLKEPAKFEPEKKPAAAAKPSATGNDFPDANAHYSQAFKLLNEKRYSEASSSFDSFVKKYPGDPLTANAYYWLGESYYARNDFTRSADSFRKGFENNPDGQKAPDNLFKLGKSLAQVKRVNEACVIYTQVGKRYGDSAPRIAKRAEEERLALQCK